MDRQTLIDRRANVITLARQLHETAETESRLLTSEENEIYDRHWAEITQLDTQIDQLDQLAQADARGAQSLGVVAGQRDTDPPTPVGVTIRGGGPSTPAGGGAPPALVIPPGGSVSVRQDYEMTDVERKALRAFLRGGHQGLTQEEYRALQADNNEAGGYVVAPQNFARTLIQAVDDMVFIRQLATKIPVGAAASLGAPSLDADPADADWTSELLTGSEDSTMDFGKRELNPYPLAKLIKISNKLLRLGAFNVEDLVQERLAYKFGVTQEKAFLTGGGGNQPLGVMTASASGISTGRDVSTGNTTTAITFDGLFEAKYSLKGQYWPRVRWIFHRDAVKNIAKLKDGEGQYIWSESVRVGEPDRLMNFPVHMSEYQSNTFTTGLYVGILGDFSKYWIADSLAMQITRLVELYAATNQIGYIGRMELDGMPVLEEAFARVTLA